MSVTPDSLGLRVELHPGQLKIHESEARNKIVAAGRRFGKTHLAACELLMNGLKSEHRGHKLTNEHEVYYVAPTFEQGKRNIWRKLKNIGGFVEDGGVIKQALENTGIIILVNDRIITIKGTDKPDSLRGVGIQFVVMDEYATMRSNVWDEIIEPALMDVEGDALFIGTPKGKNHFYDLYTNASEHNPGYEDWQAFHFTSLENPALPEREKKRLFNSPRYSAELRRQELEASFLTRGGGVLKEEWWQFSQVEPSDGYFVVTVDLGGFKPQEKGAPKTRHDPTAISLTKVHSKGWWVKEIRYGNWDTRQVALEIIKAAVDCDAMRIGIEKGSLMYAAMPYIKDVMGKYRKFFPVEPVTHGNQRKEERIMWALQGRLEKGSITLNADPSIDFFARPTWVRTLIEQANDFPSPLVHDDLIDSLSYADQLGVTIYDHRNMVGLDDWEPQDEIAGY